MWRFVNCFEKQSGHKVCMLYTDGGTEIGGVIDELKNKGVQLSVNTSQTPESTRLVEIIHQKISSMALTCWKDAKLPVMFWNYAVRHGTDFQNFVSHKARA